MGIMAARFEYERMTAEELDKALARIDWSDGTFCRLFGTATRTMERWLSGEQDIPPWVPVTLAMLQDLTAVVHARDEAARRIKLDRSHPENGEYPFLNGNHAED